MAARSLHMEATIKGIPGIALMQASTLSETEMAEVLALAGVAGQLAEQVLARFARQDAA